MSSINNNPKENEPMDESKDEDDKVVTIEVDGWQGTIHTKSEVGQNQDNIEDGLSVDNMDGAEDDDNISYDIPIENDSNLDQGSDHNAKKNVHFSFSQSFESSPSRIPQAVSSMDSTRDSGLTSSSSRARKTIVKKTSSDINSDQCSTNPSLHATHRLIPMKFGLLVKLKARFRQFGLLIHSWWLKPYKIVSDFLYWMFSLSILVQVVVYACMFYVLVLIFTGLIRLASLLEPDCVICSGEYIGNLSRRQQFSCSFGMAWTTLSTVGYGNPGLALIDENNSKRYCAGFNILLMFNAYIGIVFVSSCSAILFSKVIRIQSEAKVRFSDIAVIRYGSGVKTSVEDEEEQEDQVICPILEFRMVNQTFGQRDSEIMDASIDCVASVKQRKVNHVSLGVQMSESCRQRVVPKRQFEKLIIVNSTNLCLKRSWQAVHVLDENSPLLSASMRHKIKHNGGSWPQKYMNYDTIKKHLDFYQIIVSFEGRSLVNNSVVTTQKIYDYIDVIIGYQFVHLLKKEDDKVQLMIEYVDDVITQQGEDQPPPLIAEESAPQ